ncbi:hypothetical protein CFP65_2836 [Kitasatospora sp. MMS16-BH015]|uniref:hypothetical protein n=1 Tax=Kitasatospora sp. MMS16-BH015 TaxID=2018025 RepID=UPI000CA171FC|nr:hypothetical protein [Kitasatospora sp. MMS16-BH015]AUG77652.1 hypothetical protein CFP65_2836 [Kitasatospora sp. MMS16-BH015]
MPLHRLLPALSVLVLAVGCTTVGTSADRAAAPRELTSAQLRQAAVTDAELGAGYAVTVMTPGPANPGEGADRETADVPACQPVLDAVAPANPAAGPAAETDLSVTKGADTKGGVYAGLLAFAPGRAAQLQGRLEQVLGQCTAFTSVTGTGKGVSAARKGVRSRHRLTRLDTPTVEGADAVTAFILTNESGGTLLAQRALLARTGTSLAVFSTVGVGKDPAPEPDPHVVRAQLAKLRAAR